MLLVYLSTFCQRGPARFSPMLFFILSPFYFIDIVCVWSILSSFVCVVWSVPECATPQTFGFDIPVLLSCKIEKINQSGRDALWTPRVWLKTDPPKGRRSASVPSVGVPSTLEETTKHLRAVRFVFVILELTLVPACSRTNPQPLSTRGARSCPGRDEKRTPGPDRPCLKLSLLSSIILRTHLSFLKIIYLL